MWPEMVALGTSLLALVQLEVFNKDSSTSIRQISYVVVKLLKNEKCHSSLAVLKHYRGNPRGSFLAFHCTHAVGQEVVIVQHMGIPLLVGKSQG